MPVLVGAALFGAWLAPGPLPEAGEWAARGREFVAGLVEQPQCVVDELCHQVAPLHERHAEAAPHVGAAVRRGAGRRADELHRRAVELDAERLASIDGHRHLT